MKITKENLIAALGPIIGILVTIIVIWRIWPFLDLNYTVPLDYVPPDPWVRILWIYGPLVLVIIGVVIFNVIYHPGPKEVKK